jgi:glycosyltransferase involved in cell wall biosynthesis
MTPEDIPPAMSNPEISIVVPVLDSMRYLPETLPALVDAVRRHGRAELLVVDNGSTDGSFDFARGIVGEEFTHRLLHASIGAVRNFGAARARGAYLGFVDADCLVGPEYVAAMARVFRELALAATGASYELPDRPHWIERVWFGMHDRRGDGPRAYLNAGNFAIRRDAFDSVGGFDERLETGEDAELGLRLTGAGHRILEDRTVRAVHLGNPKSLRAFFRKQVWHGLGMFGTVNARSLDKPTAMLFAHVLMLALAAALLLVPSGLPWWMRLCGALLAAWLVPLAAVGFRAVTNGRLVAPGTAVLLYQAYFLARLKALGLIVRGKGRGHRG